MQVRDSALLLCGDGCLSLILSKILHANTDRSVGPPGERADMPQAYIIEVANRTAGIVAKEERGYRFYSSDRIFDGLEGRQFRSARDAERAARALLQERVAP
jgi:hypothetical protein